MAEPHVRNLGGRRNAIDDDDLVASVELVGFARIKAERNIGCSRQRRPISSPCLRIATYRIIAAVIAQRLQLLEHAHQRQPLAPDLSLIGFQKQFQIPRPRPQLRRRVNRTLVENAISSVNTTRSGGQFCTLITPK